MLRGGEQTGQGMRLRVYEVHADGSRRELEPLAHTYGTRPIPQPPLPWPRRAEQGERAR